MNKIQNIIQIELDHIIKQVISKYQNICKQTQFCRIHKKSVKYCYRNNSDLLIYFLCKQCMDQYTSNCINIKSINSLFDQLTSQLKNERQHIIYFLNFCEQQKILKYVSYFKREKFDGAIEQIKISFKKKIGQLLTKISKKLSDNDQLCIQQTQQYQIKELINTQYQYRKNIIKVIIQHLKSNLDECQSMFNNKPEDIVQVTPLKDQKSLQSIKIKNPSELYDTIPQEIQKVRTNPQSTQKRFWNIFKSSSSSKQKQEMHQLRINQQNYLQQIQKTNKQINKYMDNESKLKEELEYKSQMITNLKLQFNKKWQQQKGKHVLIIQEINKKSEDQKTKYVLKIQNLEKTNKQLMLHYQKNQYNKSQTEALQHQLRQKISQTQILRSQSELKQRTNKECQLELQKLKQTNTSHQNNLKYLQNKLTENNTRLSQKLNHLQNSKNLFKQCGRKISKIRNIIKQLASIQNTSGQQLLKKLIRQQQCNQYQEILYQIGLIKQIEELEQQISVIITGFIKNIQILQTNLNDNNEKYKAQLQNSSKSSKKIEQQYIAKINILQKKLSTLQNQSNSQISKLKDKLKQTNLKTAKQSQGFKKSMQAQKKKSYLLGQKYEISIKELEDQRNKKYQNVSKLNNVIKSLELKLGNTLKQCDKYQNLQQQFNQEKQSLQNQIKTLEQNLKTKDQILKQNSYELLRLQQQLIQEKKKINILWQEENNKHENIKQKLKNTHQSLEKSLQEKQKQLRNIIYQYNQLKTTCDNSNQHIKILNKSIEEYKRKQQNTNAVIQSNIKEIQRVTKELEQRNLTLEQSKRMNTQDKNKISELQRNLKNCNQKLQTMSILVLDLQKKYNQSKQQLKELTKQLQNSVRIVKDIEKENIYEKKIAELIQLGKISTNLLNESEILILFQMIRKRIQFTKLQLIFVASQHEFSSQKFHKICDNKPHLLVIVKCINGKIFGGYCSPGFGQQQQNDCSFIFSITHKIDLSLKLKPGKQSTVLDLAYGPIFGMDSDIRIRHNKATSNYHIYNNSYEKKPDLPVPARELLCGQKQAEITDYQVHRIIINQSNKF